MTQTTFCSKIKIFPVKTSSLPLWVSYFINVLCILFLTFELLFFNRTRNTKHGRKFYVGGICLSKFILCLKFEKSRIFLRFFFQLLNSKLWSLKCVILNSLVCCSIPSIGHVQKFLIGYHLFFYNYYVLKFEKTFFWKKVSCSIPSI